MAFQDFMNKIRQLDNNLARWMMRHFYFLFFQIVLVVMFVLWFINLFGVIDTTLLTEKTSQLEKLLSTQTVNITILVFLLLLNSFWILYIFNTMMRMHTSLKDMAYHLSRMRRNSN